MKYRVVIPPSTLPFSVDYLKSQLRITFTAQDSYLESLIGAATDWACGYTGRQINYALILAYCGYQDLYKYLHNFNICYNNRENTIYFDLERGPVISINNISYLNSLGIETTLSEDDYTLVLEEYSAKINLSSTFQFQDIDLNRSDAFRIVYFGGFGGSDPNAIALPEIIKNAIALKAAQFYTNPSDGVDEKTSVSENLLKTFRCPVV